MKLKQLPILIILISFMSCSTGKMVSFKENPNCETTIEGRYITGQVWTGKTPALFINESDRIIVKYGSILKISETGLSFDPGKEGPLYDPEPIFVPTEEVLGLIDESGQLVMGDIPAEHSTGISVEMQLVKVGDPNQELIKLWLRPGPPFSYCISGGIYHVKAILFHDKQGNIDRAVSLPLMEIKVHPNFSNYLGDIYLDAYLSQPLLSMDLGYMIHYRPNQAATAGMLGGAIGGALLAAAQAAEGVIGSHTLELVEGTDYEPLAPHTLKFEPIQINPPGNN